VDEIFQGHTAPTADSKTTVRKGTDAVSKIWKKKAAWLNLNEKKRWSTCEDTVDLFMHNLVNAGLALKEIHEKRYYRLKYQTFQEYCNSRFKLSRSYCIRLIEHGETVSLIAATKNAVLPSSVSQTKPLAKLLSKGGEEIGDCWSEVVLTAPKLNGAPNVTEKHVKATVTRWIAADGPGNYDPKEVIPDPETLVAPPIEGPRTERTESDSIEALSEPEPTAPAPPEPLENKQNEVKEPEEPPCAPSAPPVAMTEWNDSVEEFCRGLVRYALDNAPEGAWMDETRMDAAMDGIKLGVGVFRAAMGSQTCPQCGGETCARCRYTGFEPE